MTNKEELKETVGQTNSEKKTGGKFFFDYGFKLCIQSTTPKLRNKGTVSFSVKGGIQQVYAALRRSFTARQQCRPCSNEPWTTF